MKYRAVYWLVMGPLIKKSLVKRFGRDEARLIMKRSKNEYRRLLGLADDIGSRNPMAGNLYIALLFLSFYTANRDRIERDDLEEIMKDVLSDKLVLRLISRSDFNKKKDMDRFAKKMKKNWIWAEKRKDKYPDTWDFNFDENLHEDGFYYHFTKCPIAKFFRENNMEDMTPIFCNIDYITLGMMKGRLYRDKTLAQGDDICDFWIVGDKISNPK